MAGLARAPAANPNKDPSKRRSWPDSVSMQTAVVTVSPRDSRRATMAPVMISNPLLCARCSYVAVTSILASILQGKPSQVLHRMHSGRLLSVKLIASGIGNGRSPRPSPASRIRCAGRASSGDG